MSMQFRTKCHPESNGKTPEPNSHEYTLTFPLEDGSSLTVKMGQGGFDHFSQFILDMLADTPSSSDES